MYLAELSFECSNEIETDPASHAINGLIGSLWQNGQLCDTKISIIASPTGYSTIALLPDKDALDSSHHNKYVQDDLKELHEHGLSQPKVTILNEDIDSDDVCECSAPSSYILHTNFISRESPLSCGVCFGSVPLYRIPPTDGLYYYDIISWQAEYQACDTLYIHSGALERVALRQMTRLDSQLSLEGREICAKILDLTGCPTYYYVFRVSGKSRAKGLKRLCPGCGGVWFVDPPWNGYTFKCDKCRLVSHPDF